MKLPRIVWKAVFLWLACVSVVCGQTCGPEGCFRPTQPPVYRWEPSAPLIPRAQPVEIPEPVKQCYWNLVAIRNGQWGGSGTYLGAGLVITCEHVVRGAGEVEVQFPEAAGPIAAKVLGADHGADIALVQLQVAAPRDAKGIPLAATPPAVGEVVFSCGYGSTRKLAISGGTISNLDQYTIAVDPVSRTRRPRRTAECSGSSESGDSGGAWITADGRFRGVVWGGRSQDDTVSATVELQAFIEATCNRWRLPFPRPDRPLVPVQPPTQPPPSDGPPGTWAEAPDGSRVEPIQKPAEKPLCDAEKLKPDMERIRQEIEKIGQKIRAIDAAQKPTEKPEAAPSPVRDRTDAGSPPPAVAPPPRVSAAGSDLVERLLIWGLAGLVGATGLSVPPLAIWGAVKIGRSFVRKKRNRIAAEPGPPTLPTAQEGDPCRYWKDQLAACQRQRQELEQQLAAAEKSTGDSDALRHTIVELRNQLDASQQRAAELQMRLDNTSTQREYVVAPGPDLHSKASELAADALHRKDPERFDPFLKAWFAMVEQYLSALREERKTHASNPSVHV